MFRNWRQRLNQNPRLARILHSSLSSFAARGFNLLISLVTLPLTVRYLGRIEYGIWVTVSTSIVMLSVLDLGIANTLTNFISEAYAEDDRAKAQQYFATAFWVTTALILILAPVCFVVWRTAAWNSIFHLHSSPLLIQAKESVAIAAGFFLVSLPLNLSHRVFAGYQELHLMNYFGMAGGLLGLVAIIAVMALHGNSRRSGRSVLPNQSGHDSSLELMALSSA